MPKNGQQQNNSNSISISINEQSLILYPPVLHILYRIVYIMYYSYNSLLIFIYPEN